MARRPLFARAASLAAALAFPAAAACSGGAPPAGGAGPGARVPAIAVTVPPQAWFVEHLLGLPVGSVAVMIPPGTPSEVESYSPVPSQIGALERAEAYVAIGHPAIALETGWVEPFLAGRPQVPVIRMGRGAVVAPGSDPHIWVSPAKAADCVRAIADGLSARYPERAGEIARSLPSVLDEVVAADIDVRATLARAPRRTILVYHPALGTLARDYGLTQLAIEEDGKEPGLAHLSAVIESARAQEIRAVFVQRGFVTRPAEAVARELGGRLEELDVLAFDWPANVRAIARRLAASMGAPEGGA